MSAHTARPWRVVVEGDRPHEPAIMADEWYVATVHPSAGDGDHEANARLIAAAPELLDVAVRARRLLLEICEEASFPVPQTWVDAADAAIAKATGTDEPIPGSDDLNEGEDE